MSRVRAGAVPPLAGGHITRTEINNVLTESLGPGLTATLAPSRVPGTSSGVPGAPGIPRDWQSASGKTRAAVAYAEELWASESIDILVWITATSRSAVLSTLAEAAVAVRAAGVQETGAGTAGGRASGDWTAGDWTAGAAEVVAASFLRWLLKTARPWPGRPARP